MEAEISSTPPRRTAEAVLTAGVVLALLAILATWVPHYLTWPWWLDLDTYALIAQGWDRGIQPYRDVLTYNFPGQIYVFWALGKVFGWGHTGVFYAADVAFLLLLGGTMLAWSRRRLGGALPGLIGFLALTAYYANQPYALVAQRDWHGPLFAVLALLLVQTVRGGPGLVLSAAVFAVAFTFRPHVVLLLPAVALAIALDRPEGASRSRTVRDEVVWGVLFAVALVLAFLPLIARGLIDDLIRGIRFATSGHAYPGQAPGRRTLGQIVGVFRLQFRDRHFLLTLIANLALAYRAGPSARRAAYPWVAAMALIFGYMPFHPFQHSYFSHPINMVWSVNLAVLAWLVRESFPDAAALRAVALAGVALVGVSQRPAYCSPRESLRALNDWLHHTASEEIPPGARKFWTPAETRYQWPDYLATMAYLREKTGPETFVANALRGAPVPALNGPVGRISPWAAEGGANNFNILGDPLDKENAQALDVPGDAVVVWSPGELGPDPVVKPPAGVLLERAIRALYAPEAKFGNIEVWRRKPPAAKPSPAPDTPK